MSDVNELLSISIEETKCLSDGEVFVIRDLFKGYEWNRISRNKRILLGTLFLNYVHIAKNHITVIEKSSSGQQKYRIEKNLSLKKTFLIAGIYGVGKSTVCEYISRKTGIPTFSASTLISQVNGEKYSSTKYVQDKKMNQDILIKQVNKLLENNKEILLAGHFCILGKNDEIEELPKGVFSELQIEKIILLEANINEILSHLHERDDKEYSFEVINNLRQRENVCAKQIAEEIKKPLLIHQMSFDASDAQKIIEFIYK